MSPGHDTSGPLRGLKIIELAGIGPAPFAAMLLADMGAEVVRVERPGCPEQSDGVLDRGRRSIILDLGRPEGAATLLAMTERADVLLEGFRPGVVERLGVGPDECWEHNPRLIYGRMTGWGQDGPWSRMAGHDIDYIAITGALHAMGRAGEAPAVPLNLIGDFGGGALYLAMGVLAGVFEAGRSGRGQVVDASMHEGAVSLMAMQFAMLANGTWHDERGTNELDTGAPYYEVYETADARWMAVGAVERKFYDEFVTLLGLDHAEADRASRTAHDLKKSIAAAFRLRTRDEWTSIFTGSDGCVAPVLSMREAPGHPQNVARATFIEIDGHPQPAPAPRFGRTPSPTPSPGVAPGSNTRAVLTDYGIPDVDRLITRSIAVQR
jgi:alpha-methylacyl-CoA racemase